MRKITFEWNQGRGKTTRETMEFKDEATEDEIQKEFERWAWEQIGDNFSWHE